jgi:hypothetical protein
MGIDRKRGQKIPAWSGFLFDEAGNKHCPAMRVERRPVDVIVVAMNALKVNSCWIGAPDAD